MAQDMILDTAPAGKTAWLDTAGPLERLLRRTREEHERRSQVAISVYKRRIESLLRERDLLKRDVSEMRLESVRHVEEVRREAFEEGRIQGAADKQAELVDRFRMLARLEQTFRDQAVSYHRDSDSALVELAGQMLRRVFDQAPPRSTKALLQACRRLIDHWAGESVYRFRIHPEDRKGLLEKAALGEILQEEGARLEFLPAPEMPRGSCSLELSSGLVEGAPSEMLCEIERQLLACLAADEHWQGDFSSPEEPDGASA